MTTLERHPLGILDLAPVRSTLPQALQDTLNQAQAAEKQGFQRYWVAEHHNAPGLASMATTNLMGQIAARTQTMKVGSGGIMLPNHAPLRVAEEIGTLNALFPERIELGLGRAPGTDAQTASLLRRGSAHLQDFADDIVTLQYFLEDYNAQDVPITILGSSLAGAQAAADLGMGYANASHFAPGVAKEAIALYRERFNPDAPTATLSEPHVIATSQIAVGDTTEHAKYLMSTTEQMFYNIATGQRGSTMPTPTETRQGSVMIWDKLQETLQYSAVGTGTEVAQRLWDIQKELQADEMLVVNYTYDIDQAIKGNGELAQAWNGLG